MFIQTEETPNPLALKFLPGCSVLEPEDGALAEFSSPEEAERSPLAEDLFTVDGVKTVFFGHDFISVTRDEAFAWDDMKPQILEVIMDHFLSGRPSLLRRKAGEVLPDGEIERQIVELLDERVRPMVAQDGGDITFLRYEDGIVYLSLRGACSGCPSATVTLKMGVERLLKHYIPEIKEVRRG